MNVQSSRLVINFKLRLQKSGSTNKFLRAIILKNMHTENKQIAEDF